jgi:hypothetical protein
MNVSPRAINNYTTEQLLESALALLENARREQAGERMPINDNWLGNNLRWKLFEQRWQPIRLTRRLTSRIGAQHVSLGSSSVVTSDGRKALQQSGKRGPRRCSPGTLWRNKPWRSWLWAESSYAAAVASYGAADVMLRASAKMLDQAWEAASLLYGAPHRPQAMRRPQPMRGETERAYCCARGSLGCGRLRSEIKSAKIGIA